jgi:hypothetical protein
MGACPLRPEIHGTERPLQIQRPRPRPGERSGRDALLVSRWQTLRTVGRRYDGEGVRDLMRPNWRLRHQTE